MLYPFQLVSETLLPLPPVPPPSSAAAGFLALARTLSGLFDETPAVLYLPGASSLTLLYRDVSYHWRDVFDSAGPLAAGLNAPPRFFGTTPARETAELTVRPGPPGQAAVRLRSVSGRPFDRLQGLGVRLETGDASTAALLAEVAAALPCRAPCGVFSRRFEGLLRGCGLLAPTDGSLFAYLTWEPVPQEQLLLALTCAHKAALWRAFLQDGLQPLEFDWLWTHYYTGEAIFLLEWELALGEVLEDLGYRVDRGPASFRVLDGEGRDRRFDFARGAPAEKLFLKLLFPLDGR